MKVGDIVLIYTQPENQFVKLAGKLVRITNIGEGYADVELVDRFGLPAGGFGTVPLSCLEERLYIINKKPYDRDIE